LSTSLVVEFFDTDASSYKHRLSVPLRSPGAFRVAEGGILQADHADGTTRNVLLAQVKQYYEALSADHVHQWEGNGRRGDEITEESSACAVEPQTLQESTADRAIARVTISEPSVSPSAETREEEGPKETIDSLLINELLRRFKQAGFEGTPETDDTLETKAGFLLDALVEADITPRS
jgi:hypothetical protein